MPFDALQTGLTLRPNQLAHVQVAAIPIRWMKGAPQILLVTTRGQGRWVVPKGWPLGNYPDARSAQREAFEEAGVTGRVETYSLGSFHYWKRAGMRRRYFEAHAFALYVDDVLADWPERRSRKRSWFSPEDAAEQVANRELARLIFEAAHGARRGHAPNPAAGLLC